MANTPTSFTCADGSRTLPIQAVNDDYCDCKDGSDEPRTAACANGRFVCMGLTGKTVEIPSSRVNDGVCDSQCCDGSDEFSGLISCPVTCPHLVPGSARSSSIDDRQMGVKPFYVPVFILIVVAYTVHAWLGARRRRAATGQRAVSIYAEGRHRLRQILSKRSYYE